MYQMTVAQLCVWASFRNRVSSLAKANTVGFFGKSTLFAVPDEEAAASSGPCSSFGSSRGAMFHDEDPHQRQANQGLTFPATKHVMTHNKAILWFNCILSSPRPGRTPFTRPLPADKPDLKSRLQPCRPCMPPRVCFQLNGAFTSPCRSKHFLPGPPENVYYWATAARSNNDPYLSGPVYSAKPAQALCLLLHAFIPPDSWAATSTTTDRIFRSRFPLSIAGRKPFPKRNKALRLHTTTAPNNWNRTGLTAVRLTGAVRLTVRYLPRWPPPAAPAGYFGSQGLATPIPW
ncbi:hypothetical protein CEXT_651511 [Caerostris extrusa]|uniref:Uncharacterized protein n=1 Tax=Caerostris extrusa TaxID=172846 RepID=A0AAV4PZV8_CAEEX|nr:hypothetical protein CEXT_651511 [Caerostris extrusa]